MSEESTTSEPVRLGRQTFEAMSRGGVDAVMSLVAPDAVGDLSDGELGTVEGGEAIGGSPEDWHQSRADYRFEEEEILDLGHGVGLIVVRENGLLVGGRGRVEQRVTQVAISANGNVEWIKAYRDRNDARADAEHLAQERG